MAICAPGTNLRQKQDAAPAPGPAKISKAELKAKHAEANKQLWEAAERPDRAYFLEAKGELPLKTDFKPAVTLLSRKPQIAKRGDATNGMANLALDDEDSEEEERRKSEAAFAERHRKAQLEREEKQRKYAEVRERLFGSNDSSREPSENRAIGSRTASQGDRGGPSRRGRTQRSRDGQPTSSTDQSPARPAGRGKQLYDPNYTDKPRSEQPSRAGTPKAEEPIRKPRGPDGSGRGGFGFALRGGRPSV